MRRLPIGAPGRGRTAGEALPERIRTAIQAEQDRSEILIGWMQLGVVTMFAALYFVAPKTFSREMTFEPVPWALASYAGFTLVRLALAYRLRLPPWFLALSVAADVALLLGLIWSFHLQYMQPPSFYLKAPTVLYLFVFIALRALRFEARFVLLAGVLGAAGWLGMVAYAVMRHPAGSGGITRNYVEYMTSNAILLGAEFDKIVTMLVVAAILAVAIRRARRLLERAVADGAAARDLSRFFAPEVAHRITSAERAVRAGQGELREATVVFLDIRGFTAHAAGMAPSDVIRLLAAYQARAVPAIRAHGGSVDKFLGDGIMASFGAARPSATHAADALRAVDAVLAEMRAWERTHRPAGAAPLVVNAAAASGRIVFGAVGDETRLEYTVIGDTVNLAAKLEKQNKVEGVAALTTAETFAAAEAQGYAPPTPKERRPHRAVLGLAQPLDLVVLA